MPPGYFFQHFFPHPVQRKLVMEYRFRFVNMRNRTCQVHLKVSE